MKAIILAAGMGSRLKSMTKETPKPLIKAGSGCLIDYSIRNLRDAGIMEIGVVTGFQGEKLKNYLTDNFPETRFSFFVNDIFDSTNSGYSLCLAREFLSDDVLVLESDLIYDKKALDRVVNSPHVDCILSAKISGSGDEVYLVVDENNCLVNLGKQIDNKSEAIGELVGITKCSENFIAKLLAFTQELSRESLLPLHYEELFFLFSKTRKYPLHVEYVPDLVWREIDKMEDYEYVKKFIMPKLGIM